MAGKSNRRFHPLPLARSRTVCAKRWQTSRSTPAPDELSFVSRALTTSSTSAWWTMDEVSASMTGIAKQVFIDRYAGGCRTWEAGRRSVRSPVPERRSSSVCRSRRGEVLSRRAPVSGQRGSSERCWRSWAVPGDVGGHRPAPEPRAGAGGGATRGGVAVGAPGWRKHVHPHTGRSTCSLPVSAGSGSGLYLRLLRWMRIARPPRADPPALGGASTDIPDFALPGGVGGQGKIRVGGHLVPGWRT